MEKRDDVFSDQKSGVQLLIEIKEKSLANAENGITFNETLDQIGIKTTPVSIRME